MQYRKFGKTDLQVSEVGFGSWAIGGNSYGKVERADSLRALARAQDLGCNFVDTAAVYGDAELILGEFLRGRRDRWLIATKYSDQPEGMTATLERQLQRLNTDVIDFYQIHWAPRRNEQALYDELYRLKASGKVRYVGVSLKNAADIDYVLQHTQLDGFQVSCNLLEPFPYLLRLPLIRQKQPGIIIRSSLKSGLLSGKYTARSSFTDSNDLRRELSPADLARTISRAERFRFLETEAGSLLVAAARYPLSFTETSTVILGTKTAAQADINFGQVPGGMLSTAVLQRIATTQQELGLRRYSLKQRARDWLQRLRS